MKEVEIFREFRDALTDKEPIRIHFYFKVGVLNGFE